MTAVTTAGLLAGLFGSAFVPVAQGAGRTAPPADTTPKASLTVLTNGLGVDKETGKNNFGYLSADSSAAASGLAVDIIVEINSEGNEELQTADLRATSSNDEILLAWAYADNGTPDTCDDIEASLSNEDIVEEVVDLAAAGTYSLCLASASATLGATSTVTIYAAEAGTSADDGWVLLRTVTVTAIGSVDSIALSITDGYRYVAEENAKLEEWLTVLCRDENGTLINDATGTISAENTCGAVTEATSNPKNAAGDAIDFIAAADATAVGAGLTNEGSVRLFDLLGATCSEEEDEDIDDAGNSYALQVAVGTKKSNAITITCTENGAGAAITKVTASDLSGPQVYDDGSGDDNDLDYVGTFVDEDGRPLGDGAGVLDFGAFTFDAAAAVATELEANDPAGEGQVTVLGGEAVLTDIDDGFDFGRRGKFTIEITVTDSDLATTTDVEKVFTLTYVATGDEDVSISRTRNAAKTRATIAADMGEENAFERIEFYVELANGNVKTYVRRANADGIATLVQVRRNTTVYVYADLEDAGGSPTDVLKVKFK